MDQEKWKEYLQRSKKWAIRMPYELLHSRAYRELNYGPALKVLNWFHEKVRYEVDKRRRGKARYKILNGGEMSFTYSEAQMRGLTHKQFSRGLKELVAFGFLDIVKLGSGLQGDYSLFALSQRWREYGKDGFLAIEFPKSVNFGFRGKQEQRHKLAVGQRHKLTVGKGSQRHKLTVEKPGFA